ncbi:amine oxidase [Diplonema papillatum]|nr:amine oxidase [Diplonema papillatum]
MAPSRDRSVEHAADRREEVAVIGSGISGLTAAYLLSKKYNVSVFEAAGSPGMDAQSLSLGTGGVRVDVPIRSFSAHYYPNLLALYRLISIHLQPVNYCQSISDVGGDRCLFDYDNICVAGLNIPYTNPFKNWSILKDFLQFQLGCWWHLGESRLESITFETYVTGLNLGETFAHKFLYPMCSNMLSCKIDTVRRYPADILVEFFGTRHTTLLAGWLRVQEGASVVCDRLLAPVPETRRYYGKKVTRVGSSRTGDGSTEVVTEDGEVRSFSRVVVATEAVHALQMLGGDATAAEREILSSFRYEHSTACVHTDKAMMPLDRVQWRTMNSFHPPKDGYNLRSPRPERYEMASVSVWMNKLVDVPRTMGDVFQTWNPLVDPDPAQIIAKATFQRAVHTVHSAACVDRLSEIQGKRNIWFCGSYATRGMTLLEQAVVSSLHVCSELSCPPPWPLPPAHTPLRRKELDGVYRTRNNSLIASVVVFTTCCVLLYAYGSLL